MEFNNVLHTRRSVKNFESRDIPETKLENILNAARVAPTWGNKQCWKLVIVSDKSVKHSISEAIGNDNSAKSGVQEAPIIVVLCADPSESSTVDGKDYYLVDSAIAMEHLVLAASNEGLGTCWVGQFDEKRIKDILKIPDQYKVVALTPVGLPKGSPDTESKRTLEETVYKDQWGNYLH